MLLSLIVPVYNVEQYIRPCVNSIIEQGLNDEDFEVIIVNDGSTDNSMEMVADIINNCDNVIVVNQANQGLSVARNTGMKHASGDYILFVDSDDLLVDNSLVDLVSQLSGNPVDLLIADFVKMTNEEIIQRPVIANEAIYILKSGKEVFLYDLDPRQCYVWRTFYKRSFLEKNNISFIPGIYFEDVPFTTECYLKAEKCIKSSSIFYIYRQRQNSIVSSINKKKLKDLNYIIEHLWNIMNKSVLVKEEQKKLNDIIFATFSIEMWYLSHHSELTDSRKEVVEDIKMRVPNLLFMNGVKQMLVSILFKISPWLYLRLYSFV
jgi:glycosyltransferase involved in cell wall biosynthesis